jgi:hypothetical protein
MKGKRVLLEVSAVDEQATMMSLMSGKSLTPVEDMAGPKH